MAHAGHGHTAHHEQPRILRALALTGAFMVAEVVGGLLSGSLALLADAGHMLTDSGGLALAWFAFWLGGRDADSQRSYGYRRFEVLAAWLNGVVLIGISIWIVIEAAARFLDPVEVVPGPMLAIAVIGLIVNLAVFRILSAGDSDNLNLQGALLHVIGDLLGSVAAIVAGIVIYATGWMPIDPLLSVGVAFLIIRSAVILIRRSTHILLEGTPEGLDIAEMSETLLRDVDGLDNVHHIHAWSMTHGRPLVTLHATLRGGADPVAALGRIKRCLHDEFDVAHSVVQIESGLCPDMVGPDMVGPDMAGSGG